MGIYNHLRPRQLIIDKYSLFYSLSKVEILPERPKKIYKYKMFRIKMLDTQKCFHFAFAVRGNNLLKK